MSKYLDELGLQKIWLKILSIFYSKNTDIIPEGDYIYSIGNENHHFDSMYTNTVYSDAIYTNSAVIGGTELKEYTNNELSDIDTGLDPMFSANRLAYTNTTGIIAEYSKDGGNTWSEYELTSQDKIKLVSGIGTNLYSGNNDITINAELKQIRITLNLVTMGVYTLNGKILVNFTTGNVSNPRMKIEYAPISADVRSDDSWVEDKSYPIGGYPGWNSFPVKKGYCLGAWTETQGNKYYNLRLTFTAGKTAGNRAKGHMVLHQLQLRAASSWGTGGWAYTKGGVPYTLDSYRNVRFSTTVVPNTNNVTPLGTSSLKWSSVYATNFYGNLKGNADTATSDKDGNNIANTYATKKALLLTNATISTLQASCEALTQENIQLRDKLTVLENYVYGDNGGKPAFTEPIPVPDKQT